MAQMCIRDRYVIDPIPNYASEGTPLKDVVFIDNAGKQYSATLDTDVYKRQSQELLAQFCEALRPSFVLLNTSSAQLVKQCFVPLLDFFCEAGPTLQILRARELPIDLFGDMNREFAARLLKELEKRSPLNGQKRLEASYFAKIISANILTTILWLSLIHI